MGNCGQRIHYRADGQLSAENDLSARSGPDLAAVGDRLAGGHGRFGVNLMTMWLCLYM